MTFIIFRVRVRNRVGYKLTITLGELQKALGDNVMKFENILGEKIQLVGYFKMGKIICKMIGKKKILQLIRDYDFIDIRLEPSLHVNDIDLWETEVDPKELRLNILSWGNKGIRLDVNYKIRLLDIMVRLGAEATYVP